MSRVLVVANQTLGCDELRTALENTSPDRSATLYVVAPVTATEGENQWDYPSVDRFVPDRDEIARALAQARLDHEVEHLRRDGWDVSGEVVSADPVERVSELIAQDEFVDVIVCTLPERLSHWLRLDLPSRLARASAVPVTHVRGTAGPSI
jgi:hypothetical protein